MLAVIGSASIVVGVFITTRQPKSLQQHWHWEIAYYAFSIVVMSWVAWSSFIDHQRLLPIVAAIVVMLDTWRLVQAILKIRMLKQCTRPCQVDK